MRNFIIASVLAVYFVFHARLWVGFFGGEDLVVTTADNVADGVEYATVPVDQLPESVQGLVPEGTEVVVIPREDSC